MYTPFRGSEMKKEDMTQRPKALSDSSSVRPQKQNNLGNRGSRWRGSSSWLSKEPCVCGLRKQGLDSIYDFLQAPVCKYSLRPLLVSWSLIFYWPQQVTWPHTASNVILHFWMGVTLKRSMITGGIWGYFCKQPNVNGVFSWTKSSWCQCDSNYQSFPF